LHLWIQVGVFFRSTVDIQVNEDLETFKIKVLPWETKNLMSRIEIVMMPSSLQPLRARGQEELHQDITRIKFPLGQAPKSRAWRAQPGMIQGFPQQPSHVAPLGAAYGGTTMTFFGSTGSTEERWIIARTKGRNDDLSNHLNVTKRPH
jgi:hypothetical protein